MGHLDSSSAQPSATAVLMLVAMAREDPGGPEKRLAERHSSCCRAETFLVPVLELAGPLFGSVGPKRLPAREAMMSKVLQELHYLFF